MYTRLYKNANLFAKKQKIPKFHLYLQQNAVKLIETTTEQPDRVLFYEKIS